MKVSEWMVRDPVTVTPETEVREAIELMRRHSIRHLPVVERGRFVGLVTASGLRELILPSMVEAIRLRDAMIADPIAIGPDTHIDTAARIIYQRKVGGLPVVEGEKLLGIITVSDILKAFIDIMGVLQSSSRLDVALAERPGAFEEVSHTIASHGAEIISVGIQEQAKAGRLYFFRLAKCKVAPIVKSLEQQGHRVIAAMD